MIGLENASLCRTFRDTSALELSPFHGIALYKSFTYLLKRMHILCEQERMVMTILLDRPLRPS